MMRSGVVGVVAAMVGAAWLGGCTTKSKLTVRNDAPYPIEIGTHMTSSGSGSLLIPAGGVDWLPIYFGHGASNPSGAFFHVMPQPPRSPGRGLRWIGVEPPGPYVVRISDDGAATVYTRIEDGREVGSGSGRIKVWQDAVEPTAREWKE